MSAEIEDYGPMDRLRERRGARVRAFAQAVCTRANTAGRALLGRATFRVKSGQFDSVSAQVEHAGANFSIWNDRPTAQRWLAVGSEIEVSGSDVHALRPVFTELETVRFDYESPTGPLSFFGGAFTQGREMSTEKDRLWYAWPEALIRVPTWILCEEDGHEEAFVTVALWVRPGDEARGIERRIDDIMNAVEAPVSGPEIFVGSLDEQTLESHSSWCERVEMTAEKCRQGPLSKVVLARSTRLTCSVDRRFSVAGSVASLSANNPSATALAFKVGRRTMIAASPETLVKLTDGRLETHALAGTIGRSEDPAQDEELGRALLHRAKDRAEHRMVSQAIIQGLQPLAQTLVADHQPSLKKLANVQHLETKIVGQLHEDVDLLGVIATLHPTPALGGQPRGAALSWLEETEAMDRGWYGGFIGWMNGEKDGAAHVSIRCALLDEDEALAFAGAGIVSESVPELEWQETELKLNTIRKALRVERSES